MGLQLTKGTSIQSPRRMAVAPIFQQRLRAGLAQLVEHLICNQGVAGSNPAAGTTFIYDFHVVKIMCILEFYDSIKPGKQ